MLVCVCRKTDDASTTDMYSFDPHNGEIERLNVVVTEEEILNSYTMLRLRGVVPLGFDYSTDNGECRSDCPNVMFKKKSRINHSLDSVNILVGGVKFPRILFMSVIQHY